MGEWMGEARGAKNIPDTEQIQRFRSYAQISTGAECSLQEI